MVYNEQSGSDRRDASNDPLDILERELSNNGEAARHIAALRRIRSEVQSGRKIETIFEVPQKIRELYRSFDDDGLRNSEVVSAIRFLELDIDASANRLIGETGRILNENDHNKQVAFVMFPNDNDQESGYLYPNARISYTEGMKYVFPDLTYQGYTNQRKGMDPVLVRKVKEGVWETENRIVYE